MSFGNLTGKVAVVTGAAQGMGKAIALGLAQRGADIAICDIKKDELEIACAELKNATGKKVYMQKVDISNEAQVNQFVSDVERQLGKIDILVNNAAIHPLHAIEEISSDEWDKVFAVNIKAHFFFCKAVIPGMRKRKFGRIISISSEAGKNGGTVAAVHYAATKGAVLSFVRNLAQQVGADGITVNAIAPGRIETAMTATATPEQTQKFLDKSIIKRLGSPADIAYAVCYLASEEASFVTAETMAVNGGTLRD
ncbi:SDR family oxidoreductase [Treponema sp. OMZ 840]|uniref:SDR family NAD(P)-dependent oxidoreductase n=1 Tax=Treponema sp. OMZ 840 TaxID=244313 RepID=UPI003D9275C8